MGYTHYFPQSKSFTNSQWDKTQEGTKKIFDYCKNKGIVLKEESDVDDEPIVNDREIRFNGREDDGHETFLLKKDAKGFQFCKTARKPYDMAVGLVLLLAKANGKDVIEVQSDGLWDDDSEWVPIRSVYKEIFGRKPPTLNKD
jgi:hypothetical protein